MSTTAHSLEVYDVKGYPSTYDGYFVSSLSKMWFDASFTTTNGYGIYRVRLSFPDSSTYLYGYSRNLLAYTGNTSALNTARSGSTEWIPQDFYGYAPATVSLTDEYGRGEAGGQRTKFTFGPFTDELSVAGFQQEVFTPIKARHKSFVFTAVVKAPVGEQFYINITFDGTEEFIQYSGTGNWAYIEIPITITETLSKEPIFEMMVDHISSTSGVSFEMIEPMFAVAGSLSNAYTWCPNTIDNWHYGGGNTYIRETRFSHIDWVDNAHTPTVKTTSTNESPYTITWHVDARSGQSTLNNDEEIDSFKKVAAYGPPVIKKNSPVAYRTNDQGDADDEGSYFASEYDVTAYPIGTSNIMATYFRIGWRTDPGGSWQYDDVSAPWVVRGTTAHLTMFPGAVVDPVYSWEVGLEYKDDFVTDFTPLQVMPIPDAYALIDYHYTGRGLSIGRIATPTDVERGGINIDMPVYFDTDVYWEDLELNSACEAYSASTAPHYRRHGDVVTVIGDVKPTSEVAAGGTLTIATLPAGCRPKQRISILCQGSTTAVWLLQITSAGVITASRYRTEAGTQAMATNTWLPFSVTFLTV